MARAAAKTAETRPRNADRSQKDILDAALAEFAEFGLGGARMDRIAERAGVNKRLIYYYFESKESLFLAVLERAYEGIRSEEQALNLTQVEPVEAIRRLIAFTWNYYIAHPEFLTLLNSENLHRARHLKQSTKISAMHSPLVQTLADVLERGHKTGTFRAGVECSCTSRSPGCPTSTWATATRCRPSSTAPCSAPRPRSNGCRT